MFPLFTNKKASRMGLKCSLWTGLAHEMFESRVNFGERTQHQSETAEMLKQQRMMYNQMKINKHQEMSENFSEMRTRITSNCDDSRYKQFKMAGVRDEMSSGLQTWMNNSRNPKDRKLTTDYKKHRKNIMSKSLSNFHKIGSSNAFNANRKSMGETQTFSLIQLN